MSVNEPCSDVPARRLELRVLGAFEPRVCAAHPDAVVPVLGVDERRLLALLAVSAAPRTARELATSLWPHCSVDAALGTLQGVCDALDGLVSQAGQILRLSDEVEVDLRRALHRLRAWRRDPYQVEVLAAAELVELLSQDLLSGWTEHWALQEREWFRRVRLHALESLCQRLTAVARYQPAIRAGVLVVEAEPLRESARRALIEAHLAAGNVSEAVSQYEEFVDCCSRLGLSPGAELSAFFPPSPAWPVLHVRRPINFTGAVGRGLRVDQPVRHAQVGVGLAARG